MFLHTKELDFAKPFEGTLTDIVELEAMETTFALRNGVESLLMDNVTDVMHSEHRASYPYYNAEIMRLNFFHRSPHRRRYTWKEEWPANPSIRSWLRFQTGINSEGNLEQDSLIEILISEADVFGQDIRNIGYLLRPGGKCVIRHEADNSYNLHHEGWQRTIGQILLGTNNIQTSMDEINKYQNRQLDARFGFNNQVVGADEVTSLLDFINKSSPVTPTGNLPQ